MRPLIGAFSSAASKGAADEDHFDAMIDNPISKLTAVNYPAEADPPAPGQLRAGEHTDYGSITVLHKSGGDGGLEILDPDGAWVAADPPAELGLMKEHDGEDCRVRRRVVAWVHDTVQSRAEAATGPRFQQVADIDDRHNYDAVIVPIDAGPRPGGSGESTDHLRRTLKDAEVVDRPNAPRLTWTESLR